MGNNSSTQNVQNTTIIIQEQAPPNQPNDYLKKLIESANNIGANVNFTGDDSTDIENLQLGLTNIAEGNFQSNFQYIYMASGASPPNATGKAKGHADFANQIPQGASINTYVEDNLVKFEGLPTDYVGAATNDLGLWIQEKMTGNANMAWETDQMSTTYQPKDGQTGKLYSLDQSVVWTLAPSQVKSQQKNVLLMCYASVCYPSSP